jgi:hypothetical protein
MYRVGGGGGEGMDITPLGESGVGPGGAGGGGTTHGIGSKRGVEIAFICAALLSRRSLIARRCRAAIWRKQSA